MGVRFTRRRVIAALVALLLIGGLAASVALRVAKKAAEGRENKDEPVTLEFAPADLVAVESRALGRWLAVSGTMQPVRQATVKAKVSGDVRAITVREGDAVRAGQLLVRVDTSDLDARLLERQGQLESVRVTVHGGDDQLANLPGGEAHRSGAEGSVVLLGEGFASSRQIGSSAKGAPRASEHDRPNRILSVAAPVGRFETSAHRAGERVQLVGAVQRDQGNAVLHFEIEILVAHT
jgi:hypothetical protein